MAVSVSVLHTEPCATYRWKSTCEVRRWGVLDFVVTSRYHSRDDAANGLTNRRSLLWLIPHVP